MGEAIAAASAGSARNGLQSERRFFTGIAIAMLAVVLVGFARSFFLRPLFPEWPSPPEPIFYVHGVAFAAWVVLFLVQALLIGRGRADLHRRIGPAGVVLAATMVVLGTVAALVAAGRPTGFVDVPVPPLQFLAVPLFDMLIFPAFVWLAVAQRRVPQNHKRWMLLATIMLLPAAMARVPGVGALGPPGFFGLTDLFVIALAIWDFRSRGRLHPVTLWGGLLMIASQPLRLAISGTEAWQSFARSLVALLG
jgi:hypothetical protein